MISTLAIGAVPITFISNFGDFRADRKSTRLNSSHSQISYAVFCLKKKKTPYANRPRLTPRHQFTVINDPPRTHCPLYTIYLAIYAALAQSYSVHDCMRMTTACNSS